MSIERVNIQTPNFSLRASHIRGGQLQNILSALRRSGGAGATDPSAARLGSSGAGPGAIQSPAERFPQLASPSAPSGAGASSPSDPSSGFASGGADGMRSLDSNQMMQTIMQLLERLLQAIFQMLGQGQGGASGTDGGAGGPSSCGDGGGMPATTPDPTMSSPTSCGTGGGASPAPTGTATTPPRNGNGTGCSTGRSGRSRERPNHKPSTLRHMLRRIGKGASAAAPLVPGGGAVRAGVSAASQLLGSGRGDSSVIDRSGPRPYSSGGASTPTKPATLQSSSPSSSLGGSGSFEDRLFQFLGSRVRQSEQELDSAMQQGDSGGGQGDSRTLASQRVQQLVQKRSELVETLTNTLKTLHESTQAVTNNLK